MEEEGKGFISYTWSCACSSVLSRAVLYIIYCTVSTW